MANRRNRLRPKRKVWGAGLEQLESRLLLTNTVTGHVYLDANINGQRDGLGVNIVNGIELGDRGPVVMPGNDDGSTDRIPLGFSFEFYGRSFSEVFINNNGNLTFTARLSQFNPAGFPQSLPIVAPFWADVDTRDGLGSVHQSTGVSRRGQPYFQADWVNVGKYPLQGNRRNDFSVYIENDPLGDIVAFFYRSMQWTDEDRGAQVGFDSGNRTNYLSFGRPKNSSDLTYLSDVHFAFRIGPSGTPEPLQLEAGIAGAIVYLDENGNSSRDLGERFVVTDSDNSGTPLVNEAGRFRFDGIPTGTHRLRQELPDSYIATAPRNREHVIEFVGSGEVRGGRDFGRGQAASLSGRVFEDSNRNRRDDLSDAPLAGATVFVDANDNGTRESNEQYAITDASGQYRFARIPPGNHAVRAVAADGRTPVIPVSARQSVSLGANESRSGVNFGFVTSVPPRVVEITPAPTTNVIQGVDEIIVRFDADIDRAAHWAGLFQLVGAGGDGQFGNGNDQIQQLTFENWNAADRTLRLKTNGFLPRDTYQLTVTDDLIDTVGNRLDGEYRHQLPSGDGNPGGSFVSEFTVTNSPPAAVPLVASTTQIVPLNVWLTASDADGEVVEIRIKSPPRFGTLERTDRLGEYVYRPSPSFVGVDTFQFAGYDGLAEGHPVEGRIYVAHAPLNLVPVSLMISPQSATAAGRPTTFDWEVQNRGPGTTLELPGADWSDVLYLSADGRLDETDLRIASVSVDRPALRPDESYVVSETLTLPFVEWSGEAFIILVTHQSGGQHESSVTDNVLVTRITLLPTITLLTSPDAFLGRNRPFVVEWRDADSQGNGTITVTLDRDADPTDGFGRQFQAIVAREDADQAGDRAEFLLPPGIPSGDYFLSVHLDSSSGAVFSESVPVRVYEEAYPGEDGSVEAVGGGGYEVFGVDLAREGDRLNFRVRTNFNPLGRGGDVYVNVGGTYAGGGRIAGIGVNQRTTNTGQSISNSTLYTLADFQGGSIRGQYPIFVSNYLHALTGVASVMVTEPRQRAWRYEINGHVSLAALGAGPNDSIEVGWGMYCGNDFSSTDNDRPRQNLLGAGLARQSDSPEPADRWGDPIELAFQVTNQGNVEVGPTRIRFVVSSDATIETDDPGLSVDGGSVVVPPLGPGQTHSGDVTLRLPAAPPTGFETTGPIYIGMISDSENVIVESDETDNFDVALGIDKVELRIGRPKYVNVLIHGYDPALFNYDQMWNAWDDFGQAVLNFAAENGDSSLANDVGVHVTKWRSSEGWHSAFIDVFGYAALEVVRELTSNPLLDLAAQGLQEIFLADAQNSMARARRFAYQAASQTVADIRHAAGGETSLLGAPDEGQWIHVIGHSRGGAVGAEVTRQLRSLGYNVAQYTALDGYSTDWPFPSDILADIDIVGTVAQGGASTQINYRVQQGLAALVSSAAEDLLEATLGYFLDDTVDIGFTEAFVSRFADWRAPRRDGFENPEMVGIGSPSNHVTISPQYFDAAAPRPPFNPFDTLLAASQRMGLFDVEPSARQTIDRNTSIPVTRYGTFADGTFDEAGRVRRLVTAAGTIPSFDDPLADTILQVVRLPEFGVHTSLDVQGDFQLVEDNGNPMLELGQTNDTRFSDLVALAPNATQLTFRFSTIDAGPGDELIVAFADTPIARYDLMQHSGGGFLAEALDVSPFAGRTGEIEFRLSGPTSTPSRIRLDDLAIESSGSWHNAANPTDVNGRDGTIALDALLVINELNQRRFSDPSTGRLFPPPAVAHDFLDVNNDGHCTALDALLIINQLNRNATQSAPTAIGLPATEALRPAAIVSLDNRDANRTASLADNVSASVQTYCQPPATGSRQPQSNVMQSMALTEFSSDRVIPENLVANTVSADVEWRQSVRPHSRSSSDSFKRRTDLSMEQIDCVLSEEESWRWS